MQDPKTFNPDPSPLYGRLFNKDLRGRIFEVAAKLLRLEPEQRDDYVGTEYYVLRTVELIGEKLIADGHKVAEEGAGYYSAYGPWLDFSEMVARESFSQRPFMPKPATEPKTTPKPTRKPIEAVKPGAKLGDTISPETKAELKAAVGVIEPAPAPDFKSDPNKKKGKAKKPAETGQTEAPAKTEAAPEDETRQAAQAVG